MGNLWINGEGYYDPTAGKAISQMGGNKVGIAGDIWEVEGMRGQRMQMLILKQHESYASGLRLFEEKINDYDIEVPGMTPMWTDAGRPIYAFNDTMTRLVKTLKDEDFNRIKKQAADALGLVCVTEVRPTKDEDPDMFKVGQLVKQMPVTIEPTPVIIEPTKETEYKVEIAKYKTAAELYEKLYKELIAKVMTT